MAFVIWRVLAFSAAILLETSIARRRALLAASGLWFGLGAASKWNAVVSLAAVALLALLFYIRDSSQVREMGMMTIAVSLLFVPVAAEAGEFRKRRARERSCNAGDGRVRIPH